MVYSAKKVKMFGERRKFIRFDISLNVEFKPVKGSAEYSLGVTRNFSREGLSFVSQDLDLKSEETIELRLTPPEKDTSISLLADIIWKKQVKNKWWSGVKFKKIDTEVKSEILDYAYNLWLEKIRAESENRV